MVTFQLLKDSPEFRRAVLKLVLWAAVGASVGFGWVRIGRLFSPGWRDLWSLVFCAGALAASLYMLVDMRRIERERLEWEKRNRQFLEEIHRIDQQLVRHAQQWDRENEKDWLQ
jgi:hypothetical protein